MDVFPAFSGTPSSVPTVSADAEPSHRRSDRTGSASDNDSSGDSGDRDEQPHQSHVESTGEHIKHAS